VGVLLSFYIVPFLSYIVFISFSQLSLVREWTLASLFYLNLFYSRLISQHQFLSVLCVCINCVPFYAFSLVGKTAYRYVHCLLLTTISFLSGHKIEG